MCIKINKVGKQEVGIWWVQKHFPQYGVPIWSLWPNIISLPSIVAEKNVHMFGFYTHWTYMHIFRYFFLSNYWWQKSDIWSQSSYRYPISWEAFLYPSDSYFLFADFVDCYTHLTYICCWEKCDEKCAYMFNMHKNQLSRQTGSRNLTGPKTFPTIWHTYMKLVTKYQIPVINSCLERQKSDIWSQVSYRYPISWEAFLYPSDSCFLFADFLNFYTHLTYIVYMHIFHHIFLSNYWWQESDNMAYLYEACDQISDSCHQ
jgi:hypothetical protein